MATTVTHWINGATVLAQVAGSMDALEAKLREAAADPTGVVFTGATARAAVVAFGWRTAVYHTA